MIQVPRCRSNRSSERKFVIALNQRILTRELRANGFDSARFRKSLIRARYTLSISRSASRSMEMSLIDIILKNVGSNMSGVYLVLEYWLRYMLLRCCRNFLIQKNED